MTKARWVSAIGLVGWLGGAGGCRIVPTTPGGGAPACLDPLMLTAGTDYQCGDEVVIVLIDDPLTGQVFFDTFAFEGQVLDANRFVLINETGFDVVGDVTFLIGETVQGFENEPLDPGEVFFIDSECTDDFIWGDETEGLCPAAG